MEETRTRQLTSKFETLKTNSNDDDERFRAEENLKKLQVGSRRKMRDAKTPISVRAERVDRTRRTTSRTFDATDEQTAGIRTGSSSSDALVRR